MSEIPILDDGNVDCVRFDSMINWDDPLEVEKIMFSVGPQYDYHRVYNEVKEHPEFARLKWSNGHTLLHVSACDGEFKLTALLVKNGANVNAADAYSTPLLEAVEGDHCEIVRLLLESRADPNAIGRHGTPLHVAAWKRSGSEIIDDLLRYGADCDSTDNEGKTALELAVEQRASDEVDALVRHGASSSDPETVRLLRCYQRRGEW